MAFLFVSLNYTNGVYIQSILFFKIYISREKKSKNYVYILTKIDQSDIIVFVKIKEISDLTFN